MQVSLLHRHGAADAPFHLLKSTIFSPTLVPVPPTLDPEPSSQQTQLAKCLVSGNDVRLTHLAVGAQADEPIFLVASRCLSGGSFQNVKEPELSKSAATEQDPPGGLGMLFDGSAPATQQPAEGTSPRTAARALLGEINHQSAINAADDQQCNWSEGQEHRLELSEIRIDLDGDMTSECARKREFSLCAAH